MKDFDFKDAIVEKVLLSFIDYCLGTGQISPEDSIEKIKQVVYSDEFYMEHIDKLKFVIFYTDNLKKSIQLENEYANYNQAIILAATCVEHMLNQFYIEYFASKFEMPAVQIDALIKCNGISEKTAGLFLLTFNKTFPQELKSSIEKLKKHRNRFIHYKFKELSIDELDDDSESEEEKNIALSSCDTIQKLEEFLNSLKSELYPDVQIAQEIVTKLMENKTDRQIENADGE